MSPTETILQQLLNTLQDEFETILRAYPATYDNCPGVQAWHFGLPDLRRASQMPLVAIDLDRQSSKHAPSADSAQANANASSLHKSSSHTPTATKNNSCANSSNSPTPSPKPSKPSPKTPTGLIQEVELADYTPPLETETNAPFIRFATLRLTIRDRHPRGMP
jgi:hypothetical protein